ncbi:hypothetical protein [Mucilaginibacter jinjuensis]|uniref:Uncharacterized protein n=1 Tax=Mucilaginibacter jinjuensis TaxID=1176721 RepID=A0ABY7TEU6_9SPHI|nr:hypothetical protein [Mucilaginibacter jinjuensis]WCT14986.1 hypothetical protein PQO05_13685 [Mucilaginibacter jinjuensis]
MSITDFKNAVKAEFGSQQNLSNIIDLDSLYPISMASAQLDPTLKRFFWLDENGPFSEITQRGLQSLRKGFYKIVNQPYYRTTITPGTFAADVYYLNQENDNLIKYHANIGPLTNTSMAPFPFDNTINNYSKIPILNKFYNDKAQYGYEKDYYVAKKNFYDSVYKENRIFFVAESTWDPAYPTINKRKQVKWCFIDY